MPTSSLRQRACIRVGDFIDILRSPDRDDASEYCEAAAINFDIRAQGGDSAPPRPLMTHILEGGHAAGSTARAFGVDQHVPAAVDGKGKRLLSVR